MQTTDESMLVMIFPGTRDHLATRSATGKTGDPDGGLRDSVENAPLTSTPVESVHRENAPRQYGEAENRDARRIRSLLPSSGEFNYNVPLRVHPATGGEVRSTSQDSTDGRLLSMGNLTTRLRSLLWTHIATATSPTTTTNLVVLELTTQDSPGSAEHDPTTTPISG